MGGLARASLQVMLVTSVMRHILSRGSSCFLAVLCIIAVRKLCGLKNPGSQTDVGRINSLVQALICQTLQNIKTESSDSYLELHDP